MEPLSAPVHPPLRISLPSAADPARVRLTPLADLARYVPGEVRGAVLLQTDRLRQVLFCVAAGDDLPRHRATCDVALTVVEGAGTLALDGEAPVRLRPGLHVVLPAATPHAVTAEANLALLATFAHPAPEIHFLEAE